MRNFLFLSLFASLFVSVSIVNAQDIVNYQLTENNKSANYENLAGSFLLIGNNKADQASAVHELGFQFVFMGKVYQSFSVNTNGVLRLGDEQILPGANTYGIPGNDRIVPMAGVSAEYRYRRCFFGYCWDEWGAITGELETSTNGKVHYSVTGAAPDRVLTVEWKDMTFTAGYKTARTSFQVKLHESVKSSANNGRIEFIYNAFDLKGDYRNFSFRTGFGIGPEQGNFVAINQASRTMVTEQNFLSGPVSGNISWFRSGNDGKNLIYRFQSYRKPVGTFSDFAQICPAPNALTIGFNENCSNEAGIVVFRKKPNQPDNQLQFVASLPPDARSFSDGEVVVQQSYLYRFYLLGEGQYSDSYSEYTTQPVLPGMAYQAVGSGKWTSPAIWGGHRPENTDDVEIGCAKPVFVSADGDAQVQDLVIHKGSFLTIEDGVTLSVSGDFINNGVFNPLGSGRLILNGADAQGLTNNGQGITNDQLFTSDNASPDWDDDETGQVAEKSISVSVPGFSAVKSVKVNITHSYLRDLTLYLVTPDGSSYLLSRGRGQRGQNYSDVIFTETGQPLPSTVQNVNLKGEYRPEESFASYSGPFGGTWRLRVSDGFSGSGGSLNNFELILSKGGSNDLVMRNLSIQNTSNEGVTLNSGVFVQGSLLLNNGVLHSKESAPVVLEAGATCNEGSAVSYVSGPVFKKGNANFTFPTGKDGRWAPLAVSNLKNADASTTIRAEYFGSAANDVEPTGEGLTKVSGLEYWDLTPTAGSPTVDISLFWKDADFSGISELSSGDLTIAHYTGGAWRSEISSVTDEGNGTGFIMAANINTFSPFTLGSVYGNNPLPVSLISFTATAGNKSNHLQWSTASELNNSHFEVERSEDGINWDKIAMVEGAGTTNTLQRYEYLDYSIFKGLIYYRLKQVDFDGQSEYSNTEITESLGGGEQFSFFPNPANSFIHINSPFYPAEMVIMSHSGAVVWKGHLRSANEKVELSGLTSGLYVLQLIHAAGMEYQQLVIAN